MEKDIITGPLGLWTYPILNFLYKIILLRTQKEGITPKTAEEKPEAPKNHQDHSKLTNIERWEWVDYKGKKRELTIHREVVSSPSGGEGQLPTALAVGLSTQDGQRKS